MAITIPFRRKFSYTDDKQLAEALVSGDEGAVAYVFYGHYKPLLNSMAQKVLTRYQSAGAYREKSIEQDDLIQELYIYMSTDNWEKVRRYDSAQAKFTTWLGVVAFRFFKDYCEKEKLKKIDSLDENPIPDNRGWEGSDLWMDLKRVLPKFEPPRDRNILIDLVINDKDPQAVAKKYNVTVDNLYNIKRRALIRLTQQYLTGYNN